MPPRKSTRRNPPIIPTQTPTPPQFDTATLNVAVAAAVTTTMAQYHNNQGTSGGGTIVHSTQGDVVVCSQE